MPSLIVMSGLPGTGKTTISKVLARDLSAFHLRIDTIEAALKRSMLRIHPAQDAGYLAAYGVAADNLFGETIVIADSVNPVLESRLAWQDTARSANAQLVEVEVVCSDVQMHRQRVEARMADIPALAVPDWKSVASHAYQPWTSPRLVIDTAHLSPAGAAERIAAQIVRKP
ncbi:MAG: AAA family ATPase [Pseudomonadota bacterium]